MPRRPRVTCRFRGGPGNQLFTIAAAIAYGARHDLEMVVSPRQLTSAANPSVVGVNSVTSMFPAIPRSRRRVRSDAVTFRDHWKLHEFQPIPAPRNGRDIVLEGLFGHSAHFVDHRPALIDLFRPMPRQISRLDTEFAPLLDQETVSVSVRRGDFLLQSTLLRYDDRPDFYARALEHVPDDAKVLVFSDDLDWCRASLELGRPLEFVTSGTAAGDMYLVGRCTHHVITNSTYAWWGAWLDNDPGGVTVQPERWFTDSFVERLGRDPLAHDPGGWISV